MTSHASAGARVDALRDRFQVQRWIVRVGGPGTWLVVGLAALRAVAAVIAVAFALVMRACIDQGFSAAVCAFGVLLATQVGVLCACRALSEAAQATLENRFRQQALAAMLEGDFGLASGRHTGDVSARMTSDARVVAEGATGALPEATSSITRLLGPLCLPQCWWRWAVWSARFPLRCARIRKSFIVACRRRKAPFVATCRNAWKAC
mgnify:CR=1 FL=1